VTFFKLLRQLLKELSPRGSRCRSTYEARAPLLHRTCQSQPGRIVDLCGGKIIGSRWTSL